MKLCEMTNRGAIRVSGADAHGFLQGLVTVDMDEVDAGGAGFGALLTPQGKILFDFLIARDGDGYVIDTPSAVRADLAKRLGFYKLRAKVEIADLAASHMVIALWDGDTAPDIAGTVFKDPRHDRLGWRAVVARDGFTPPPGAEDTDQAAFDAHRLAIGIPEAGADFDYGDVFPHDVDMDQLRGVSFHKGCFVGQEVVSRMQHRATARRRIVKVSADQPLPPAGTEITADGKTVGALGSSVASSGLALIRLDRAKTAIDAGTPVLAGDVELRIAIPDWAGFDWPDTTTETA